MNERTVTNLSDLKAALAEGGISISEKKLRGVFDDGCPGESGSYPVDRVAAWLIEKKLVENPADDTEPGSEPGSDEASDGPQVYSHDDRVPVGTVLCHYCNVRAKQTSSQALYAYYKCPSCSRTFPVQKPTAREALRRQSRRPPQENFAAR